MQGIVEERHVEAGTYIRKGQLLFVIGAKRFRPKPMDAKSALAATDTELERSTTRCGSNIQEALCDVTETNTNSEASEVELNHCRVYAPIDGRVSAVKAQLGDLVRTASVGHEPSELAAIEQLDPMGICVPVDARVFRRAAQSGHWPRAVSVASPRSGDRNCPNIGKLLLVESKKSAGTSSIEIKFQIDNHNRVLRSGETIRVAISFGEVANAVVVPEQAILDTGGASCVYVVNRHRRVEIVPVNAGFSYNRMRMIDSGIEPGHTVVVDGFSLIRSGSEVRCEFVNPR